MADTDSILHLGIEAARAGDQDEARNFFRLLTREKPDDPQGWLWLAGVAEDREEKRAALERVLELDPTSTLASQGLAALGGPSSPAQSAPPPADDFSFDLASMETQAMPSQPSRREEARTRQLSPDEEFAMSLDSLSSMSNATKTSSSGGRSNDLDFDIPDFGEDDFDVQAYMNRERVDASTIELSAAEEASANRSTSARRGTSVADTKKASKRNKGLRASGGPLIPILIGVGMLLFGIGLFLFLRPDPRPRYSAAQLNATATARANPAGGAGTTQPISGTQTIPDPGGNITTQPTGEGAPTIQPLPVDPNTIPPTAAPPAPVLGETTTANPQLVPATGGIPIEINGWYFNYGGISGVINGPVGSVQPQGRWLIVVPLMNNATGIDQPIPADLLTVKDAQGRLYRANLDASEAYYNANAAQYNIHHKQNAPQGFNFVLPLMFDVAPDATELVLFSPLKPDQGYRVRGNVQ